MSRTGITSLVVTVVLLTSAVSVLATPVLSQVTDQPFYDVSSYTYDPQPAIAGQPTTLSVSIVNVTQDSQTRPAAGETVTFTLENPVGTIGQAVTDSNGIASISYTFSSPGTHTLHFTTRSGGSIKSETITVTGNTNTPSPAGAGSASATAGTWHIETVDNAGDTGYQTSLALNSAGWPAIAYHERTNGVIKYAFKDASGWHNEIADRDGGSIPSLQLTKTGWPAIAYNGGSAEHAQQLRYAYKDAGGWHIEVIDAGVMSDSNTAISLALNATGWPAISYNKGGLKYAFKDASGWHNETVTNVKVFSTSLALTSNDRPAISYYDGVNAKLMYTYSDGSYWYNETVDSSSEGSSLRLTSANLPAIGYYLYPYVSSTMYAYKDASGWHNETVQEYPKPAGTGGGYTSLALNSTGWPVLCYHMWIYSPWSNYLMYAYKDASGWQRQTVDSAAYPSNLRDFSLQLTSTNWPAISYQHLTNSGIGELKYAYSGPAPESTTTTTPSATTGGGFLGLPGFEALYAVAGLLAVGYLVMRRRK